jgi:hypothetical protein
MILVNRQYTTNPYGWYEEIEYGIRDGDIRICKDDKIRVWVKHLQTDMVVLDQEQWPDLDTAIAIEQGGYSAVKFPSSMLENITIV